MAPVQKSTMTELGAVMPRNLLTWMTLMSLKYGILCLYSITGGSCSYLLSLLDMVKTSSVLSLDGLQFSNLGQRKH